MDQPNGLSSISSLDSDAIDRVTVVTANDRAVYMDGYPF